MESQKKNPLVSVVIPTYNVEEYLLQCLDSLNAQTYKNFECIIIIDGATDNSYDIAQKYCSKHHNFYVYYQNNSGSGPARNKGIAHSSGEFICFVDPDDWVDPCYIEELVVEQQKGNYDLVVSQCVDVVIDSSNKIISKQKKDKPSYLFTTETDCRENFSTLMFVNHLLDAPYCKLFKTEIIKQNKIHFPAYRRSQDIVFNFRYYNFINSVSTTKHHSYNLRIEYPPKPNRGRIFDNYDVIVSNIYKELDNQLKSWNLKIDCDVSFHTWMFWYLYAFVKRCAVNNLDYSIIKEEPFYTILNKARPVFFHQKIIRILLKNGNYKFTNIIIRTLNVIKNYD